MIGLAMMLAVQDVEPLDDYMTGTVLLAHCSARDATCTAYIEGVIDLQRTLDAYGLTKGTFCPSAKLEPGLMADITVRWLRAHPQSQHMGAGPLVVTAVSKIFPCPKS
ncbi:Rap1a/Tai family immunity protein [Sphingomonas bacterium]|uniref:Rap1a/Tai family immunity protein n=1 Tax=Sphingomonas bacterium TaxID=1895847 RepID=UPI00260803DB|nr:Rap1a/Tai family immunity protein [Sphingomonas bacterium]MDB5677447.1 hypothetical protein [Sphingomonas bacterium]